MLVPIDQLLIDSFGANRIRNYSLDTLVKSIKENGFLINGTINVMKCGMIGNRQLYRVINGSRRCWAAQIAGIERVFVNVIETNNEYDLVMDRV